MERINDFLRRSRFVYFGCCRFADDISWLIGRTQLERTIPSARKPHILFTYADDFAFDCTGFSGNAEIQTPNLDRLARRNTHFTQAYNMGGWNGVVCIASREMLNTGQRSIDHRLKPDSLLNQTFVARENSCDLTSGFFSEMELMTIHRKRIGHNVSEFSNRGKFSASQRLNQ